MIASKTDHGATMDELVHTDVWARKGTNAEFEGLTAEGPAPQKAKSPPIAGTSGKRLMGFEPTTFCMASRRSSQLSYSRASGKV